MRLTARELASLGPSHPLVLRLKAQGLLTPTAVGPNGRAAKPARAGTPGAPSKGEAEFALQVRALGLPEPMREHRFHPSRPFRFDFAWPSLPCSRTLAVEIEGGIHSRGRHVRPAGYKRDLEKYNSAVALGWTLLRFSSDMVFDGTAVQQVCDWLRDGGARADAGKLSPGHPCPLNSSSGNQ